MKSLDQYWYSQNVVSLLLRPVSWLYCLIIRFRKTLYFLNIKRRFSAAKPVVVVGNIAVGGSGKTPLLIALCDYLKAKGYSPGIVSRGYGGAVKGVMQVTNGTAASLVGDEPLMICQKTLLPVVVGADRVKAVEFLLNNNQCDVVLSDDGLQHYRMKRDLEICVVDSVRLHGNGHCLPAGPLREPVERLKSVDMIVYSGVSDANASQQNSYSLDFVNLQNITNNEKASVSSLIGETVHAVAGIGCPSRFFQQLRDAGLTIIEHAFPDHHVYQSNDFLSWSANCIVMTEKDAVKCKVLSLPNAWFVEVKTTLSAPLELQLSEKLLPLLKS